MAKLTVDDVRAKVDAMRDQFYKNNDWDDERAHSYEDALYEEVLRAIADGNCKNPRECAAELLRSKSFDFSRWTA